jgi:hypothetical protein
MVESDVIADLNSMLFELSFNSGRGAEVIYNITKFEKGVYPFRGIIHHPNPARTLKIKSSIDAFFYLTVWDSTQPNIEVHEDEYLYTSLEKEFSFVLAVNHKMI